MADPKPLSRDQLAKFLPDNEAIRRFERLFAVAGDLLPSDVTTLYRLSQEASIDAGLANTRATEASDSLQRIARSLEVMASNPRYEMPRSFQVDYLDFDGTPPHVDQPRRVAWNDTDDTLNLHHLGGVIQQIGLETYLRFQNNTLSTITNGSSVGLEYVGGVTSDEVVPYIADGTMPTLNIIGVATQDIAPGEYGRATVWGRVRDIDTTGTPYGEVWAKGDVIYPSPTVVGGLTNLKPTAPDVCIPIAVVVVLDATLGAIFIRPTIEQEENFGAFSDLTDQAIAAIYTPQAITFNTTDATRGISIGAPASRIVSATSGLYSFLFSLQVTSNSASTKTVYIWARINGVDVPNTMRETTITGAATTLAAAWGYILSMQPADYFELMFASDSTSVQITHNVAQVGATGTAAFARPATPSAILTVSHVAQ